MHAVIPKYLTNIACHFGFHFHYLLVAFFSCCLSSCYTKKIKLLTKTLLIKGQFQISLYAFFFFCNCRNNFLNSRNIVPFIKKFKKSPVTGEVEISLYIKILFANNIEMSKVVYFFIWWFFIFFIHYNRQWSQKIW